MKLINSKWEIMAIENCELPSGPRTIAVSWNSYLLVGLLTELRANDAQVKCRCPVLDVVS